jgi:hypothetical protein
VVGGIVHERSRSPTCKKSDLLEMRRAEQGRPLPGYRLYGAPAETTRRRRSPGEQPWLRLHNMVWRPYAIRMNNVVIAKITASGQLSLPAPVRRRWAVSRVAIADEGDRLVVRPVPADPIKAACGSLASRGGRSETVRTVERRMAAATERRRVRA